MIRPSRPLALNIAKQLIMEMLGQIHPLIFKFVKKYCRLQAPIYSGSTPVSSKNCYALSKPAVYIYAKHLLTCV